MATMRSVDTDRHIMVRVDVECTTSSRAFMRSRPTQAGDQ
jgi:hypothetical protein